MTKTCSMIDCNNKFFGKTFCQKHYLRWYRYGDPDFVKGYKYHGLYYVPEHSVWTGMKTRCNNKKEKSYKNYGARGIKVCDRWSGKDGFINFYKDMGSRPSDKHSIDRIDGSGNYEPGNCRWATKHQQGANQRINSRNTSGYKGVHFAKHTNKWLAQITLNTKRIHLGVFVNKEEAVEARKQAEQKYWGVIHAL